MKFGDLRPGDVLSLEHFSSILIARVDPHPIFPGLSLFVWIMVHNNEIMLDALSPEYELISGSEVDSSNRPARLREAIFGQ